MHGNDEPVRWHVWRLDKDCFGVQNLGARTVTRVIVNSPRNEAIAMGYVEKAFVRRLEWFIIAIPRELQQDCDEITVTYYSGRSRMLQTVRIADAVRSQPSPYRIDVVSDHLEGDVYRAPVMPY